jgi:hypothetical protein
VAVFRPIVLALVFRGAKDETNSMIPAATSETGSETDMVAASSTRVGYLNG